MDAKGVDADVVHVCMHVCICKCVGADGVMRMSRCTFIDAQVWCLCNSVLARRRPNVHVPRTDAIMWVHIL